MPLSILAMPTEVLALILAACSIGTLPGLAATNKLIGEASDERRKRIAVLKLPPFETTPYAVGLKITYMQIGEADLSAFVSALSSGALPLLVELDLCGNQIGDAGISALVSALSTGALPLLEELNLCGNQIGDAGISAFASAMSSGALPRLEYLWLHGNKMSDVGVLALAAALKSGAMASLQYLSQKDRYLSENGDELLLREFPALHLACTERKICLI